MLPLDPQLPLSPVAPSDSHPPLQYSEAEHPEPDILRPIPFRPEDSALRPTAPSGSDLHIWFANLSQGKQVLTLLVAGLFLLALLGVLLQLIVLAIQIIGFGIVALLLLRFLARPNPE